MQKIYAVIVNNGRTYEDEMLCVPLLTFDKEEAERVARDWLEAYDQGIKVTPAGIYEIPNTRPNQYGGKTYNMDAGAYAYTVEYEIGKVYGGSPEEKEKRLRSGFVIPEQTEVPIIG
jgi:hypothetical protein